MFGKSATTIGMVTNGLPRTHPNAFFHNQIHKSRHSETASRQFLIPNSQFLIEYARTEPQYLVLYISVHTEAEFN